MRRLSLVSYWLLRTLAALGGIGCFLFGGASLRSGNYRAFFFLWLCSGLLSGLFILGDHFLTHARTSWSDEITAARLASIISGTEFNYGLDVLFVDEAAQMSLANVLAVSQSAKTVVL